MIRSYLFMFLPVNLKTIESSFCYTPPIFFLSSALSKAPEKRIEIFDGSKRLRALGEVIPPIVRQELANHRE